MEFHALSLKLFVVVLFFEISTATFCQPPDVPSGGYYNPRQAKYLPGDKVVYYCYAGYMRSGKDTRTCQINGKWTDKTPFCDWPVKLKNPKASSASHPSFDVHRVIDKNTRTCFSTKAGTNQNIMVHLDDPAVISGIRMYLPKGLVKIELSTFHKEIQRPCSTLYRQLDDWQWVIAHCNSSHKSDSIYIHDISGTTNFFEICEVEVYVKDTLWCKDPPDIFIPNGWLKVSRDKTSLQCAEGYKPGENTRLVCESSGKWNGGILQCEEILCDRPVTNTTFADWQFVGSESKLSIGSVKKLRCEHGFVMVGGPDTITCLPNGTWTKSSATCEEKAMSNGRKYTTIIIAVSALVSIVMLTCFVIVVVLLVKRKSKPVVVVLKQGEDINNTDAYNETQYSTITYDTMPTMPQFTEYPTPPSTRPPLPASTNKDYSKQMEQHYPPPYNTTPKFEETFQETEMSSTETIIGTLKNSSLYGS